MFKGNFSLQVVLPPGKRDKRTPFQNFEINTFHTCVSDYNGGIVSRTSADDNDGMSERENRSTGKKTKKKDYRRAQN